MARLELRGLDKTFAGGHRAADQVDLTVESGELFVIVGPSGSGKSTLLRLMAGLESLDGGEILLDGVRIDRLSPSHRDVAMVFQDQVLYPHLNVFENLAFGLKGRRVSKLEIDARVTTTSQILGLGDSLGRMPSTLSGGQRRRVALGRALVLKPRLFLLDEPFSGLDAPLRTSTRAELADLNRKLETTMVLVTHDQAEALALGDRVAVLDRGRVVQVARPLELYDQPKTRFVARFIGQPPMNFLPCLVAKEGDTLSIRVVALDEAPSWSTSRETPWTSLLTRHGRPRVDLGLRPEQIQVRPRDTSPTRFDADVLVRRLEPAGPETLATLDFGRHQLIARLPSRTPFLMGDSVKVGFDLDQASWFDPDSGDRLTESAEDFRFPFGP